MPPRATFSHPIDQIKQNQFRDGVVYLNRKNEVVVEVGAEQPLKALNNPGSSLKDKKLRVTTIIRRLEDNSFAAEIIPKEAVEEKLYWGYSIKETNNPLHKFNKKDEYIVIGTSRTVDVYTSIIMDNNDQLAKKISSKKPI